MKDDTIETFTVGRCTVKIYIDQDPPNPMKDYDGEGIFYSFSNRHINSVSQEKAEEIMRTNKFWVPLSYFEHGLCLWDVQHGEQIGRCPDMQWDGVSFAGIWIPDDYAKDNLGIKPKTPLTKRLRKKIEEYAAGCCKTYTSWCNGECYGYVVSADGAEDDSCWGFLGDIEYCKERAKSVAETMDKELAETEEQTELAECYP